MRKMVGLSVMGAMSVFAADYTWLADPASDDWLTGLNWSVGGAETAWTVGTGDTATFDTSATTDITVDGTIGLTKLIGTGLYKNGGSFMFCGATWDVGTGGRIVMENGIAAVEAGNPVYSSPMVSA